MRIGISPCPTTSVSSRVEHPQQSDHYRVWLKHGGLDYQIGSIGLTAIDGPGNPQSEQLSGVDTHGQALGIFQVG